MRSRSIPRPEPLSLSRSWEPPRLPRPRPATNEYPRDPGPHFRPDPALRSETTFPPSPRAIRAVTGGHPVGHEATRTPRTGAREAPPTTFAAGYRPGTYPSVTTTNTSLISRDSRRKRQPAFSQLSLRFQMLSGAAHQNPQRKASPTRSAGADEPQAAARTASVVVLTGLGFGARERVGLPRNGRGPRHPEPRFPGPQRLHERGRSDRLRESFGHEGQQAGKDASEAGAAQHDRSRPKRRNAERGELQRSKDPTQRDSGERFDATDTAKQGRQAQRRLAVEEAVRDDGGSIDQCGERTQPVPGLHRAEERARA